MWLKLIIWYKRIVLAFSILFTEGFKSLWTEVRKFLNKSLDSYQEIENIEEEIYDSKKKLMILIPTMEMGGVEKCTSILLEHLNRIKIKSELVTIFDREAFYPVSEDVKHYILERIRFDVIPSSSLILPQQLNRFTGVLRWMEMVAFKFVSVIKKRQPTVILAQDYYASLITLLAKKHIPPSIKLIVSSHNSPSGLYSTDKNGELYAFLTQSLFNNADYVIAVSEGVKLELEMVFSVNPDKIIVIHNPVDIAKIKHLADEEITEHPWFAESIPIILFVGRLAPYKGVDYLLRAISNIRNSITIRCVIIGDGEESENLQRLSKKLGIVEDVLFFGRQHNPFKFMKRATIFALPSLTEGLPYVLIEALACGCPIIATDSPGGGPSGILKGGKYGLLVPPGDEKALSEAILKLLRDNELRQRLASLGLERAVAFSPESIMKLYEDLVLESE